LDVGYQDGKKRRSKSSLKRGELTSCRLYSFRMKKRKTFCSEGREENKKGEGGDIF